MTVRFLKELIPKTKPAPKGKDEAVDRTNIGSVNEEDHLMDSFIPIHVDDAARFS